MADKVADFLFGSPSMRNYARYNGDHAGLAIIVRVIGFLCDISNNRAAMSNFLYAVPQAFHSVM
ncbi:MAG: hypothetical protein ACQEWI_13025 [Bacillota bacterium]